MKRLEQMKESLMACVQNQIAGNLSQVDAKELGEAVDMIKDLSEAIYYCTITEAMNEKEELQKNQQPQMQQQPMYYPMPMYYPNQGQRNNEGMYFSEPIYNQGSMYNGGAMYAGGQGGGGNSSSGSGGSSGGNSGGNNARGGGSRGYHDMPMMGSYPRDIKEGMSPMYRRMYMESKELNQDNAKTMHDLEKYIQELSGDVMEMIEKATPEEKQVLRQKITTLATKIK